MKARRNEAAQCFEQVFIVKYKYFYKRYLGQILYIILRALILERQSLDPSKKLAVPDDLIRTLAIFLVVLLHASNEALQAGSVPAAYWWTAIVYKSLSLSCVPLFVMLSGLLLLQPAKLNEPLRVFLKKRLSRLGLAFAFWSAVYLAWGFYVYKVPVTLSNVGLGILKDLFTGAWYHFWFIYLIVGLYLITPILRIVIAYASRRMVRYLILLWFVGVAVLPIIQLASGYALDPSVFILGGFVGYFVLGTYLQNVKVRSAVLYGLLIAGFASTVLGMWLMNYPLIDPFNAQTTNNFFIGYLSVNVIVGSAALFLILLKARPDWPGTNHAFASYFVKAISKNTLPIFLFHIIILETFERGLLGFTLDFTTLNPILEIPLLATLTFFISLGLVLLMRKVPVLKKLIG
jgi:surface polysaccharide O-acyltransferase-like enzyme